MTTTNLDRQHVWHPFTQAQTAPDPIPITSAKGIRLYAEDGREFLDLISSWWVNLHGHAHPTIAAAIAKQAHTLEQVIFAGFTHQPAAQLAHELVQRLPAGLTRVFFSDDGSTAVEVALKMALQYWQAKGERRQRILTLRHGYHGDTFGAMSVCDPQNSMHSLYQGYLAENLFARAPQCRFDQAWDPEDITDFAAMIAAHSSEIAAVILEPIVQGAGGMRIYHPAYLREVRALCDQHQILLIADEIATGFGRTGKLFACEHAQIVPDILCLGKALTGGYLTLSATLTTRKVAETISNGDAGCFMHGPTFMANPLACAVASANLNLLAEDHWQQQVAAIENQLKHALMPLAEHKAVADVRVLGAIGVVEMRESVNVARLQRQFVEHGVWIRPFGKLIYLMPPYIISPQSLARLTDAVKAVIVNIR